MFQQRSLKIHALAGKPTVRLFREGGFQEMVEIRCRRACVRGVFHGDLHRCGQFRNAFFPLSAGFSGKGVNPLGLFCNGAAAAFCHAVQHILRKTEAVRGDVQFVASGQSRLRPALRAVAGGGRGFGDIGHVAAKILQCADAAFDHRGGGALQIFLILIEIKAPVADIQAQGVPRGVIHAAFRRHIDHVALKFVRQLPVGSLNVQELAELSGERLCFFQQPGALFIVLFPAKGRVSELLRKPGDFCLLKAERVQRAGVE